MPGLPRFRVNAFRQRGDISFAFRVIPREVPDFASLHLPPGVERLVRGAPRPRPRHRRHRRRQDDDARRRSSATSTGRAGSTSSRSRTRSRSCTSDERCIVNQREVGLDTESFDQALRRALRQDPDVILIGELRDSETAETALQAAESGHLVLSTMHTVDAAETISRLVEFFPAIKQPAGPLDPRRRPQGRRLAAAAAAHRRRPRRRGRGDGREQPHPGADPRGQGRVHPRGDRRRRVLRHADADRGADRARRRRARSSEEIAAAAAPNRHDFMIALGARPEGGTPSSASSAASEAEERRRRRRARDPAAVVLALGRAPPHLSDRVNVASRGRRSRSRARGRSFLNVVAARVPLQRSIVHPGSACMSCATPLAWYDNIPVLSYAAAARPLPALRRRDLAGATRPSKRVTALLIAGCVLDFGLTLGRADRRASSAPRSSRSRRPTSSAASSRTGSSCRPPASCSSAQHDRCTRRSSGRSPASARRSSSCSPRSPTRPAWGWATSSSRCCSASCSAAPCRSR